MNDEGLCGRFVYIQAYIDDPKSEGKLKVWKHNRFRWFDRMIVEEEIDERTTQGMPWKINQAGTSLCRNYQMSYKLRRRNFFIY
ncbi:hypothetical protein [Flavobacterium oreochromis]|uniref:Uncharacterized protein n=1 Tax=Flavobacterium columnare TaxID=996 RepID=A0A246G7C9_9FLAO|nr:hypothetical protein [Flavobacterium oreochromis]OWP74356.1 hypothetical protein BWK62_14500 [Flavobacterium oreochromis]